MSLVPRMLACLLLVAVGACSSAPPPADTRDPTGPLEALAECPAPAPAITEGVQGLILPEGALVQQVTPSDPLTNIAAYVEMTPVEFEQYYRNRDGIEVLVGENEIYEAEMLVSDGTHRNFLRATAVCRRGVQIVGVVAPEVDAEGLPVPQGAATPSSS